MGQSHSSHQARPQRDLSQLLLTLPQELFDRIYIETFTAEIQTVQVQVGRYNTPELLSISRDSRAIFAKSYFAKTTFEFDWSYTMDKWLFALEDINREALSVITLQRRPDQVSNMEGVLQECIRDDLVEKFGQDLGAKLAFTYHA